MRKWVWRFGVFAMAIAVFGYWVVSGFSFSGTFAYSLEGPNSDSEAAQRSWRYRLGQKLLPILYEHDTQYAARYSEQVFHALPIGAPAEEVLKQLGEPLSKNTVDGGRTMWHYSKRGIKTEDFFVRILEFDAEQRLLKRHAEFYVD